MEAVLQTVEKGRFVPAEVRVNDERKGLLLSLLSPVEREARI